MLFIVRLISKRVASEEQCGSWLQANTTESAPINRRCKRRRISRRVRSRKDLFLRYDAVIYIYLNLRSHYKQVDCHVTHAQCSWHVGNDWRHVALYIRVADSGRQL